MIFRRCMAILHKEADADDATQEVFANFFEKEGRFEIRPEGFGGLLSKMAGYMSFNQLRKNRMVACQLYALATNVSLNRIRDQKGMGTGDIYYELSIFSSTENKNSDILSSTGFPDDKESEQVVDRLFVEALLEEEDEKTRDIYFLRFRDNMTFEEIGEVVGLSTAAVHKRFKKFVNTVRLKLGREQK